QDDRITVLSLLQEGAGLAGRDGDIETAGGDLVRLHELLGEYLARFDFRGRLGGAEDRQVALLELVDDAEGERQFRPHQGQVDVDLFREVRQLHDGRGIDRDTVGDLRHADVAGSAIQLLERRAAAEFPAEGVLAGATSDDEDLHSRLDPERRRPRRWDTAPRRLNPAMPRQAGVPGGRIIPQRFRRRQHAAGRARCGPSPGGRYNSAALAHR